MLRRLSSISLCALLLGVLITAVSLQLIPAAHVFADSHPMLTLNRQEGPLGVTLTLSGKKFPLGNVGFSYLDAQSVPGVFVAPSDTSAQVQDGGTFVTTNLIMPASGPVGSWKIFATDSQGSLWTIGYNVLAAPGAPTAGAPSLSIDPPGGMSGDAISFNGTNWLPQGTVVNLVLQAGTNSIPLLQPSPASDKNGVIVGTFHLPSNLDAASATISATDASTGALRAQVPILINGASPTATASPTTTVTASPTDSPTVVPTSTPISQPSPTSTTAPLASGSGGSDTAGGSLANFNSAVWGPVLLVVGGVLGVAGLMLVLFMLPWGERERGQPHGRS